MENKENKNEEIQSRREFFKEAAKKTLPLLGALMIANIPLKSLANERTDCDYACTYSCSGSCAGSCDRTCYQGCDGLCYQGCSTGCSNSCYFSCSAGCARQAYA